MSRFVGLKIKEVKKVEPKQQEVKEQPKEKNK